MTFSYKKINNMEPQLTYPAFVQKRPGTVFSIKKLILLIAAIGLVAGISIAYYLYNKPHQSVADETPAFIMDAPALVSEYDANEKLANQKYLGKIIEVHGIISEKLRDNTGKYNVTLQGADIAGIGCEFEPKAQQSVSKLKMGQQVTIKGICSGVLMDVVMVDCIVVTEK
jgi:hypothetical protein